MEINFRNDTRLQFRLNSVLGYFAQQGMKDELLLVKRQSLTANPALIDSLYEELCGPQDRSHYYLRSCPIGR